MYHKNNDFEYLVNHACAALTLPHQTVKEKYIDYPICLMRYIEKGNSRDYVEVSFDSLNASVTFIIGKDDRCYSASIHFYTPKDEALFIIFLRRFSKFYNYRKKCWILKGSFYSRIEETKNPGTLFFFYKLADVEQ